MKGNFAFVGNTAEKAYQQVIDTNTDCDLVCPSEMRWFTATEVKVKFLIEPIANPRIISTSKK